MLSQLSVNFPFSIRFSSVFLSLALALGVMKTSSAATVELSNGDRVTGEIVSMADGKLILKSSLLGQVSIDFQQVIKLVGDDSVVVQLEDGRKVTGKLQLTEKGLTIDQDSLGKSENLSRSSVVALNPPKPQQGVKYSGRLNVGGSFTRGNSEEDVLNIDGEVVARALNSRYTGLVEINESKTGNVTTTSNQTLAFQYDAFLTEKDFLFVNSKFEADDQLDLNLRTTLGAGYGRQFYETETIKLSAEAGLSFVNEDYELAQDESFPGFTLGSNYEHKFFDGALVLFNRTNLSVNLEDSKDALLKNKLGLRFPVGQHLNLSTQLNVDYDNLPPANAKKTDTSLIFSVGAGF